MSEGLMQGSVLFGVLIGAIVVFAELKAAEFREIQPSNEKIADNAVVEESDPDFEFYEVLKRNDLYPPLNNWKHWLALSNLP